MAKESLTLHVPAELQNGFFFEELSVNVEPPFEQLPINFIYELLFYNGKESFKPWENPVQAAVYLKEEWVRSRAMLEESFRNRDPRNIPQVMKIGIGLFLQLLFWSNERPVVLKEPIAFNQLDLIPNNLEERLSFIFSKPNLFPSFRQLSELMDEQEKLLIKKSVMKKASKPNG